jgi:hypothetical protein
VGNSKLLEIVLLGLWLLIAVGFFYKYKPTQSVAPVPNVLEAPDISVAAKGKSFDVARITVNSGSSFDFSLKDQTISRILADLPVNATKESRQKIVDLLNNATKPRIVLRDKQEDGHWLVDFFVTQDGKEIDVSDWLKKNKLVYQ